MIWFDFLLKLSSMTLKLIASISILSALAGFAFSACSGSDLAGGTGSSGLGGCTTSNRPGLCFDSTGTANTAASVRAGCEGVSGTYIAAGCPTASRIGSCTAGATATQIIYRYYSDFEGGLTAAQAECTAVSGTFTAN